MQAVFAKILNMSITGSIVIAVVLLARLFLKRAPKEVFFRTADPLLCFAAAAHVKSNRNYKNNALYNVLIGDINTHQIHTVCQRHDHEGAYDSVCHFANAAADSGAANIGRSNCVHLKGIARCRSRRLETGRVEDTSQCGKDTHRAECKLRHLFDIDA